MPNNVKALTIKQVADALQVTDRTVLGLIERGKLTGLNLSPTGKRPVWRVTVQEFDRFLDQGCG